MNEPESIDTFVVSCTKQGATWTALSAKTRQVGIGADPNEALTNCISAVDEYRRSAAHTKRASASHASHELLLALVKTAQPLPGGEYKAGVVYRYDRS
jgi:hypothetical protein